MPFAGEHARALLRLLAQFVTPAIEHAFGHAQSAGDLGHGRLAALAQAHRFELGLTRVDTLLVGLVWLVWLLVFLGHAWPLPPLSSWSIGPDGSLTPRNWGKLSSRNAFVVRRSRAADGA